MEAAAPCDRCSGRYSTSARGHVPEMGIDTHRRFRQYRELPDRLSKGGMAMKISTTPSWLRRRPLFGG